ncbi:MAG: leucine-rich repeat domain-containing protein [Kiritimatiellae bacterium]|nr:leucine-rich repeat domain-containing protein [Kiritimatiellia bacterium]
MGGTVLTRYNGPEFTLKPAMWKYEYVGDNIKRGVYKFTYESDLSLVTRYCDYSVGAIRILSWKQEEDSTHASGPFFKTAYACPYENIRNLTITTNTVGVLYAHSSAVPATTPLDVDYGYLNSSDMIIDLLGTCVWSAEKWGYPNQLLQGDLRYPFIKYLGPYSYASNSVLTSVVIPEGVSHIEEGAFMDCTNLVSVTLPSTLEFMDRDAFIGCCNLKSVVIPQYVCDMSLAFAFPSAYQSITNVVISGSVTAITNFVFYGCSGLTNVTIPDSVTSIEESAFRECINLTNVTIPDSVISIGDCAFMDCDRLKSVTIGNGVTSIGDNAFAYCDGLTEIDVSADNGYYSSINGLLLSKDGKTLIQGVNGNVTIPDSVTSIGGGAFNGCSGLTGITILDNVINIADGAFAGCISLLSIDVTSGNNVYKTMKGLLMSHDGQTLVAVPGGLTNVTIPDSVTNIGDSAFFGCSSLTSVTIPNSVTNIGLWAFSGCNGLTRLVIPDSMTEIDWSFNNCNSLTSVTIPNSVTNIKAFAFIHCSRLACIVFEGNAPMAHRFSFSDVKSECTAYVRKGSTGWGVEIPGTWNGLNICYLTPETEIDLANEAGEGAVELNADDLLDGVGVASGVTLMVNGESLDAATLAKKITIKPHEEGQSTSFFKVKTESIASGVSLAVVLDEDAVKPDETAAEVVAGANMAAIDSAAEGANVSVKLSGAKQGLYYGVAVAGDVAGLEKAAENVPLSRAGADGVTVPVVKPAGGAAFFKVVVSDRAR